MEGLLIGILVAAVCCAILGALVGSQKQAGFEGGLLGFFFGPLGVIVAFAIDKRPRCPNCSGRLDASPRVCQHCHAALEWVQEDLTRFALTPEQTEERRQKRKDEERRRKEREEKLQEEERTWEEESRQKREAAIAAT